MTSENTYRVGLAINYWDDPHGLIDILTEDSVYDFVTKIFVIDGRYENREDMPEYQTNYIDDISSIYTKVHVEFMSNRKQIDKRNKYWELAEEYSMDYMIVCDSDEYLKIEPDIFTKTLRFLDDRDPQCYPIVQHMDDITSYSRPRLFKAPFNFRHTMNKSGNGISHGSLYDKYGDGDEEIIAQMYYWYQDHEGKQTGVPGIEMWHDKKNRSRERVIRDRIYYDDNPDR